MDQNKKTINILLIIIMILVFIGCVVSYLYFVQVTDKEDKTSIFSVSEYPKVDGSISMLKLAKAYQSAFTGEDINNINISHSKTEQAYTNLINKNVDLILVPYPTEGIITQAQEAGVEFEIYPIVKEAFLFFVNKNNPVENLTLNQIKDIYSGTITNWKDVGGTDSTIIAYQRPNTSDSQKGMISLVMQGTNMKTPDSQDVKIWQLTDVITDYSNSENAIGYAYNYYYNTLYDTSQLKIISIDGVEPSYENIKTGLYSLQTESYAIIRKDEDENSNTRKLLKEMNSDYGKSIAKEVGYVQNN